MDARLADGSRVNVVLPPISLNGPTMTIRKFPKEKMTMERLIEVGALSEDAAEFLKRLVKARSISLYQEEPERQDYVSKCII